MCMRSSLLKVILGQDLLGSIQEQVHDDFQISCMHLRHFFKIILELKCKIPQKKKTKVKPEECTARAYHLVIITCTLEKKINCGW